MKARTLSIALVTAATALAAANPLSAALYSQDFESVITPQTADGSALAAFWTFYGSASTTQTGTIIDDSGNNLLSLNTDSTSATNWQTAGTIDLGSAGFASLSSTALADNSIFANLSGSGFTGADAAMKIEFVQRNGASDVIFGAGFIVNINTTPSNYGGSFDNASYVYGLGGGSSLPVLNPDSQSIVISYENFGSGNWGQNANNIVGIDDVTLTSVPEPHSMALIIAGASLLALRRKRRATAGA